MPRLSLRRPLAVALLGTAAVACAAPDSAPASGERVGPFGRAARALRREIVGDRRLESRTAASDSTARRRDSARTRAAGRPDPTNRATPPESALAGAAAGVPWDTTEVPTRVIPFTTVAGVPDTIWMGDTLVIAPPPAPEGTPSSIARDLRWTSAEPAVATVSRDGVVSARAPGEMEVIAWRRVGQTVTHVTVLPAVRGRVAVADGATVRTRVVAVGGGWADTTWTDDDGGFALRPTTRLSGTVTVRFDPASDTHVPALLADVALDRLDELDVVLLPVRWRIAGGSYAGTTVPIDPSVAYASARRALRLWRVARPGRGGAADRGHAVGWAASRLPLPLAFDRRGGDAVIGAGDSAAFWRIVHQLERDWGAPLFRPATLAPGDDGFGGVVATVDPRIGTAGLTTTGWNGQGDLYDAVVAVRTRSLLADPAIVTHELLHALGVGHAPGALASVMHPVSDPFGSGRASAADVAYGQLLYSVRARTRPGRTAVGVAEAVAAGER